MALECYSCIWWLQEKKRSQTGYCRRGAPVHPAHMDSKSTGVWPKTKSTDYCGQFEARTAGTPIRRMTDDD